MSLPFSENSLKKHSDLILHDSEKSNPNRFLKIAFIRRKFNAYGGGERFLGLVMDRLVRLGHEVHIFSESWQDDENRKDIHFHKVSTCRGPAFVKILSFAFSVNALLKREKFHIVHSFERTFRQDIYRAGDGLHLEWIIHRFRKRPLLETAFYLLNPLHLSMLFLENELITPKKTKFIICNSRRGAAEITRRYKYPKEKIRVIYNGVAPSDLDAKSAKKARKATRGKLHYSRSDFVVLYVGSGYRRKGVETLIRSLPHVQEKLGKRNLRLLIIGKDNRLGWYKKLTINLGIDDIVTFAGPSDEVRDYYLASDLFVLPTIYEPFSNACLEAFSHGIPVITTEANGFSEIIEDGKNGKILKESDGPNELAEFICYFADDGIRQEAASKAKATADGFTIDKTIEEILEVYESSK